MKTAPTVIRYASKQDYLNRSGEKSVAKASENIASSQKNLSSKGVKEELSKAGKDIKEKVESKVEESKSAGEHILSQAGTSLARAVGSIISPSVPSVGVEVDVAKTSEVKEVKESKLINKPGIFIVKGFSMNPFESEKDGLGEIAANIPSAEIFGWDGKSSIIEAIKSRPHSQPIILVGHGMGGDTIVDVANELNKVEHGFRQIDLLITLDSIGLDNDIIPQNVRQNLNIISDEDYFFNDGPNIARKKEMTSVVNELRTEDHDEMETAPEVQFMVYDKINSTLMNAIAKRDIKSAMTASANLGQKAIRSHQFPFEGSSPYFQNLL